MKNFRKTFKNFRKDIRNFFGCVVVGIRWQNWLATVIWTIIVTIITVMITRSFTIETMKESQRNALIDSARYSMENCKLDEKELGGHCVYEITYDGDIIVDLEVTRINK